MKNFIKKILKWFKREFVWMTSKNVLDAINRGATYEEIEAIVEEEVNK